MSTAIATIPTNTMAVAEQYLESFGNKLTKAHKNQFLSICQSFGLNPFLRQIYGIPFGDKFNIIVGYEVYLQRAENSGQLAGWRAWTEGEGKSMKGCVEITRKDWRAPFYHEAYLCEYDQNNQMWKSKPMTMIKKVAIAQGFRMAFPVELGGIPYTADEMPSTPEVITPIQSAPKQLESVKQPITDTISRDEAGAINNELKAAQVAPSALFDAFGIKRLGELKLSQWDEVLSWIAGNAVLPESMPVELPNLDDDAAWPDTPHQEAA